MTEQEVGIPIWIRQLWLILKTIGLQIQKLSFKVGCWLKSKGGFAHIVAVAWGGAILAYSSVPPFHRLIIDIWAKTPPDFREGGLAAIGLIAWYTSTQRKQQ